MQRQIQLISFQDYYVQIENVSIKLTDDST